MRKRGRIKMGEEMGTKREEGGERRERVEGEGDGRREGRREEE